MTFLVTQTIVTTATADYEIDADSSADAVARFKVMTHEQREERQIDFHETDDVQVVARPANDAEEGKA